jgi:hypothetical protein
MSPKLQVYAAIGEIVSAVAVVVSILFLAYEIRENTEVMRATAAAESRDSLASSSDLILNFNNEMLDLMARSSQRPSALKDLSAQDRFRMMSFQRSIFRRAEAQFFRYQAGLLDEEVWGTVRNRVVLNIANPLWREIWDLESRSVYTKAFIREIESQLPMGSDSE